MREHLKAILKKKNPKNPKNLSLFSKFSKRCTINKICLVRRKSKRSESVSQIISTETIRYILRSTFQEESTSFF